VQFLVDNRSDSTIMHGGTIRFIMSIILLGFMTYLDLNLVMNSIRILNKNEISFNFRLPYFMAYSV